MALTVLLFAVYIVKSLNTEITKDEYTAAKVLIRQINERAARGVPRDDDQLQARQALFVLDRYDSQRDKEEHLREIKRARAEEKQNNDAWKASRLESSEEKLSEFSIEKATATVKKKIVSSICSFVGLDGLISGFVCRSAI